MTRDNLDPANPVVILDYTVDHMRSKLVRENIAALLSRDGVESITLLNCAMTGMIDVACDLHEHLREIRSAARIPIRAIANGICGSAATLVLLAFVDRRCTVGTTFTMQKPFFDRKDLDRVVYDDDKLSKKRNNADRFYKLFGEALGKNPTDAMLLFDLAAHRRVFTPKNALDRGIVTDVIPASDLRAA